MSNKITCTCGHSWNKSSSSKKDMRICHICGKDNTMKNGGWLDAYDAPQAENGIEGTMGGLTDQGFNYNGAWGGTMEDGGDVPQAQNGTLEKIYSKWPALKKLGKVTVKPDESFTREKTGVGDIEFFSPDTPQVTYPNGYVAPHPGPGTYGILYNPATNDEQGIRLDMLHGMPQADRHFKKLRNTFERAVKHSDIKNDMDYWYDEEKKKGGAEDGRRSWIDNYVDGQLRTLLFEGDRSKQNYSDEEANQLLSYPKIKSKFDKLNTYLQKGEFGSSVPGSVGFTYARTQGIPSEGPYAKKTMPSAQNGKEMSFYQNGLDWTPRNISKNGSEIPQAQIGTMVTPLDFSKPLGTLEGVSEVMSAPARTATYLLTGKYQDPSQALGIKNPWGALAADMVLDPMNLVGAGLAKKAIRFKPNPEMMYRGIGEEGFKDAIKSGVYRQAGIESGVPKHKDVWYASGNKGFSRAKGFSKDFIAEVPKSAFPNASLDKFRGSPGMETRGTSRHIPITEGRVLKKDWLKGYKEIPKPKKKEGGKIKKDDNGYWNPDNWGKPVEIGSNDITMRGLQEMGYNKPLLGISDTGDTQMMYPGEDYKFDGESVTEYPVKKNGGWLDKYN